MTQAVSAPASPGMPARRRNSVPRGFLALLAFCATVAVAVEALDRDCPPRQLGRLVTALG